MIYFFQFQGGEKLPTICENDIYDCGLQELNSLGVKNYLKIGNQNPKKMKEKCKLFSIKAELEKCFKMNSMNANCVGISPFFLMPPSFFSAERRIKMTNACNKLGVDTITPIIMTDK